MAQGHLVLLSVRHPASSANSAALFPSARSNRPIHSIKVSQLLARPIRRLRQDVSIHSEDTGVLQDKRLRPHAGEIVLAIGLLMLCRPEAMFGQRSASILGALTAAAVRAPVVVGLPVPQLNAAGELTVQPNVASNVGAASPYTADGSVQPAAAQEYVESLPPPGSAEHQNPARACQRDCWAPIPAT